MSQSKCISEKDLNWVEVTSFNKVASKVLVGSKVSKAFAFLIQQISPGGNVPKHSHPEESLYYFIEGRGKVYLGEKMFDAGPGSTFYISSNDIHGIDNTESCLIKYIEIKCPNTL